MLPLTVKFNLLWNAMIISILMYANIIADPFLLKASVCFSRSPLLPQLLDIRILCSCSDADIFCDFLKPTIATSDYSSSGDHECLYTILSSVRRIERELLSYLKTERRILILK